MQMDVGTWDLFIEHAESVSIVRGDAFNNNKRDVIVESIKCVLQPLTPIDRQRNALNTHGRVGIDQTEMMGILAEPNELIKKGHILISDDSEFRVEDVFHIKNTDVMQLALKSIGVA